jgi:uncharacterized protein YdbL (DUF1318 family)
MEKFTFAERYKAVAKALAQKGVTILLDTWPEQPLTRVEYITLTHLLAGGGTASSLAQQKAFLKSRGVLNKADIGHIKSFQGKITITRDGNKKTISLTGAEPVLFRDLDETDFGARLELQLDYGSILSIGEDTALKIDEMVYDPNTNRRSVSLRLTVGTIRVKVSKNKASGSRFRVITPTTVLGVRGTEFTVSVEEQGKTRVTTLEGAVAVRPVAENERRPTSKAEQNQGAPPEKGTEEVTAITQNDTRVTDGEFTEITTQTTKVETSLASYEDIREVTQATEVSAPIQIASVSSAETKATDVVVGAEIAKSSSTGKKMSARKKSGPGETSRTTKSAKNGKFSKNAESSSTTKSSDTPKSSTDTADASRETGQKTGTQEIASSSFFGGGSLTFGTGPKKSYGTSTNRSGKTTWGELALYGMGFGLAVCVLLLGTDHMRSRNLASLKKAGWVGECPDGYLDLVKEDVPDKARKIVRNINRNRQEKYQKLAKKQDTTLKLIETTNGKKLIEQALPGELIKSPTGEWERK